MDELLPLSLCCYNHGGFTLTQRLSGNDINAAMMGVSSPMELDLR